MYEAVDKYESCITGLNAIVNLGSVQKSPHYNNEWKFCFLWINIKIVLTLF